MALFIPNCAKKRLLQTTIDPAAAVPQWFDVVFFKNNHTPVDGDAEDCSDYTPADFTDLATGLAVAPYELTWGAAAIVSDKGQDTASTITVVKDGATGNTLYGAIIRDEDGNLTAVEKFPSPISVMTDGESVTLNPISLCDRLTC
jgi:hypothetical protein